MRTFAGVTDHKAWLMYIDGFYLVEREIFSSLTGPLTHFKLSVIENS